jgi:hypothetical protein
MLHRCLPFRNAAGVLQGHGSGAMCVGDAVYEGVDDMGLVEALLELYLSYKN